MSLTLSAQELELVRKALAFLASPLGAEGVDQWRSSVNDVVREIYQADQAIFLLSGCDAGLFYSNEYDEDDVLGPYVDYYRDLDEGMERVLGDRMEVFCRRQLFDGETSVLAKSECYNDFFSPNGMEDSLGMAVHSGGELSAGLWVHNQRPGRPNLGERGLEIATLLYPAFRAGTAIRQRFHRVRSRLGALLDTLHDGVAVVGAGGETVYRNRALRSLLAESPAREEIEARIGRAARGAAELDGSADSVRAAAIRRRFTAAGRGYGMETVRIERSLGLSVGATMVVVRESVIPPSPEGVRARCGLTKRQAEVAVLLWRGETNKAIAEELVISPHTARHHTEHVLRKLGIHSREDVRAALER